MIFPGLPALFLLPTHVCMIYPLHTHSSETLPLRTNIVIDDALLERAMRATGAKTKREAVELGLASLIRLKEQEELRGLRGKLRWTGDLERMRRDR